MDNLNNNSILKIPSLLAFFTMALTCLLSWNLINTVIYWEILIVLVIGFLYTFKFKTVMGTSFKWKYSGSLSGFVLLKYIALFIDGFILRMSSLSTDVLQYFNANPFAFWLIFAKILYAYILLVTANRIALFLIGENDPIVIHTEAIGKNIKKSSRAFVAIAVVALLIAVSYLIPRQYSFHKLPDMNFARSRHSAILLDDGRVYITGGVSEAEGQKSAEVYNPKTNKFERVGDLSIAKKEPTLLKLKDGRIFIFGENQTSDYRGRASSAEIYDPKTDKYELLNGFEKYRQDYNVVLLDNGSILIPGNYSFDFKSPSYIKNIIFDPNTKTVKEANIPLLDDYNAVKLLDGSVFIMGKVKVTDQDYKNLYLVYNPVKNVYRELNLDFQLGSGYRISNNLPKLILLKNGNIALINNSQDRYGLPLISFFNPKTETIKLVYNNNPEFIYKYGFTTTLLNNGKLIFTGGSLFGPFISEVYKKAGMYDPTIKTYDEVKNMNFPIPKYHDDNRKPYDIQIPGDVYTIHKFLPDAVYNTYEQLPEMTQRRSWHTATLLQDGNVLITGGYHKQKPLKNAELLKISW